MKVIILAGGRATRLPQSAKEKPKCLIEVDKKTILQHQIEHLTKHGLTDVRLSLGWMANQVINFIKNKYPHIEYVVEKEALGTGGGIKFTLQNHPKPFLALYGDIISDFDLARFLKTTKPNSLILSTVENAKDYGLMKVKDNVVVEYKEKPGIEIPGLINAGVYYLNPQILRDFPRDVFSMENDIFPDLVKERKLSAHIHKGFWIDMGTEERLLALKAKFLK